MFPIYKGPSQWLSSGNSRNIIAILSTGDGNSDEGSTQLSTSAISSQSPTPLQALTMATTTTATTTTTFRQAESLPLWSPVGGSPLPEIDILFHSDQISSPMRLMEEKKVGRKGGKNSSARQRVELHPPLPPRPLLLPSSSSSRENRISIAVPRFE